MQNKNLVLKDVFKRNKSYQDYKAKFKQEIENAEKFDAVKDKDWYLSYYEMLKQYIILPNKTGKNLLKIEEHKDENGDILSLSFLEKNEETFFKSLFEVHNISYLYKDYWVAELSMNSYYESLPKEKRNDAIRKDIELYRDHFNYMRKRLIKQLKNQIKNPNKISGLEIYEVINKTSVFKNRIREDVENKLANEKPVDFIEYESDYYKKYTLEQIILADDFFDMTADEIREIMDKNLYDWSVQRWLGSGLGTHKNDLEDLSSKIEKRCMCGIKTNPEMILKFYYEILAPSIAKATREQWFKPKFGLAYNYLKTNPTHQNYDVLSNALECAYEILIDNDIPKRTKNILDTFDNLYEVKVDENIIQEIKRDCEYIIEFMQKQNIVDRNNNLKIEDEDLTINFWDKICEFFCVVVCAFSKLFSNDYKIANMAKLKKLKMWLKNTVVQSPKYDSEFNSSLDIAADKSSESKSKVSVLSILNDTKSICKRMPVLKNEKNNRII